MLATISSRSARRRAKRLTQAQQRVLALIREYPTISYDEIAARLQIDRSTAIQAVMQLALEWQIVKIAGAGRQPNRYVPTDRLIITRPGYTPGRVILTDQARRLLVEQWEQSRRGQR